MLRPYLAGGCGAPRGFQHARRLRPAHHGAHARQRRDRAIIARRGTAHHDGLEALALARQTTHEAPQLRLALVSDGARVHDRDVRGGRVVHDDGTLVGERLAHQRRVVLIGLAAKGVEIDVHGRTVSPTNTRPCANARPVPSDPATSVGALGPGPNGTCPPRAPRRIGIRREPNSAPADHVHVSNAPAPALDQERHAAAAANRALGLGTMSRPPPAMSGRSVTALVVSATLARSRLSLRAQPAMLRPGARPMSTLPDTPNPS